MITVSSVETVSRIRSKFSETLFISSSRDASLYKGDILNDAVSARIVPGSGTLLIESDFNYNYSKFEDTIFSKINFRPDYDSPGVYALRDSWNQLLISSSAVQDFEISLGTNDIGALVVATAIATNCPDKIVFTVLEGAHRCLTRQGKIAFMKAMPNLRIMTVNEYLSVFPLMD